MQYKYKRLPEVIWEEGACVACEGISLQYKFSALAEVCWGVNWQGKRDGRKSDTTQQLSFNCVGVDTKAGSLKDYHRSTCEYEAACLLQRAWRGYKGRAIAKVIAMKKLENDMALRIQNLWRTPSGKTLSGIYACCYC